MRESFKTGTFYMLEPVNGKIMGDVFVGELKDNFSARLPQDVMGSRPGGKFVEDQITQSHVSEDFVMLVPVYLEK